MEKETREQELERLRIKDFTERGEWVRFADAGTSIEVEASLFSIYAQLIIWAARDKSVSCSIYELGEFNPRPGLHKEATDVYFRILKHGTATCLFVRGIAPGIPYPTTLLVYFSQHDEEHEEVWARIRKHLTNNETENLVTMLADVNMDGTTNAATPTIKQNTFEKRGPKVGTLYRVSEAHKLMKNSGYSLRAACKKAKTHPDTYYQYCKAATGDDPIEAYQ